MDPLGGLIVLGIGYGIFKAIAGARRRDAAELAEAQRLYEQDRRREAEARRRAEQQRRTRAAAEAARRRPFADAWRCFTQEYVSFTRIRTYASCPRRFKLIYLDRKEAEESESFTGRGTFFHRIAEECLNGHVGHRLENVQIPELLRGYRGVVRELHLRKAIRYFVRAFPQNAQVVAAEHELSFSVGNVKFFGIVDAVVSHPDGSVELLDFKTGTQQLPRREQLEIYCLPFSDATSGQAVKLRYMLVDRRCSYCWSVTPSQAKAAKDHILGLVRTITQDTTYAPRIGSHCRNCGVRAYCSNRPSEANTAITRRVGPPAIRLTPIRIKPPDRGDFTYTESPEQTDLRGRKPRPRKGPAHVDRGLSFDLVRASRDYVCVYSAKPIKRDDWHFADHRGRRMTCEVYRERYPETYRAEMDEHARSTPERRGLKSYRLVRAIGDYSCCHCAGPICRGEDHFADKKGKRLHQSCYAMRMNEAQASQ